jgi:hypothetical protein
LLVFLSVLRVAQAGESTAHAPMGTHWIRNRSRAILVDLLFSTGLAGLKFILNDSIKNALVDGDRAVTCQNLDCLRSH